MVLVINLELGRSLESAQFGATIIELAGSLLGFISPARKPGPGKATKTPSQMKFTEATQRLNKLRSFYQQFISSKKNCMTRQSNGTLWTQLSRTMIKTELKHSCLQYVLFCFVFVEQWYTSPLLFQSLYTLYFMIYNSRFPERSNILSCLDSLIKVLQQQMTWKELLAELWRGTQYIRVWRGIKQICWVPLLLLLGLEKLSE